MAITKNHTINATLKKAIDYICAPAKTDGAMLIYSYGCTPETADIEFEWTRKNAADKGRHLARHIIQSFAPGETTPAQAYEIGKRFAEEILGGEYEFVLSTHIDKGCIHNHIICNDVDFVNYKHIHINRKWYYKARQVSDELCREYGLSVIEPIGKGKSYAEYTADKNGGCWKTQLRRAIDSAIKRSLDFEDFLLRMELAGYTVKRQNKNISFCISERQKFMRSKTLGEDYTVEAIKDRIEKQRSRPKTERRGVSLLIDIQNSIKAQESKGYEHWAKVNNLKQASKTINYITEHNISTVEELKKAVNDSRDRLDNKREELKSVESRLGEMNITLKHLNTYSQLKPIYEQYRRSKNRERFREEHRSEIILYEAAAKALKADNPPTIDAVKETVSELAECKTQLYEEYRKLKRECAEIEVIQKNVNTILETEREEKRERENER